jgi:hypothetical protein
MTCRNVSLFQQIEGVIFILISGQTAIIPLSGIDELII